MYTKSVYVGRGNGGEGIVRSDSQFYNLVADKKEKISKKWATRINMLLPVLKQPNNRRELDLMDTKGKRVSTIYNG